MMAGDCYLIALWHSQNGPIVIDLLNSCIKHLPRWGKVFRTLPLKLATVQCAPNINIYNLLATGQSNTPFLFKRSTAKDTGSCYSKWKQESLQSMHASAFLRVIFQIITHRWRRWVSLLEGNDLSAKDLPCFFNLLVRLILLQLEHRHLSTSTPNLWPFLKKRTSRKTHKIYKLESKR
jgi:hypothetical protein